MDRSLKILKNFWLRMNKCNRCSNFSRARSRQHIFSMRRWGLEKQSRWGFEIFVIRKKMWELYQCRKMIWNSFYWISQLFEKIQKWCQLPIKLVSIKQGTWENSNFGVKFQMIFFKRQYKFQQVLLINFLDSHWFENSCFNIYFSTIWL